MYLAGTFDTITSHANVVMKGAPGQPRAESSATTGAPSDPAAMLDVTFRPVLAGNDDEEMVDFGKSESIVMRVLVFEKVPICK